jgi:hypothetical protein
VKLRGLSGWQIVSQRKTSHAPGAGDFVAVLVPIITTPDVNVVERRAVRFDSDLHEVRARTSELETEDA